MSRPLRWLLDMELVRRCVPVTEREPERSKRALYRLADPYLAFWYRFVSPLVQAGLPATLTPKAIWQRRVEPHLDEHMGSVFEDVVRQFLGLTDTLPFQVARVGAWWDARSENELDVVALSDDGEVLIGECKWGTAGGSDLDRLRQRASLLMAEMGPVRQVHLALFTGRGLGDARVRAAVASGGVRHYRLTDLFAPTGSAA